MDIFKKVVHFTDCYPETIKVGGRGIVYTLDHPTCNSCGVYPVYTSRIVYVDAETGDFETLNTNYVKVADKSLDTEH